MQKSIGTEVKWTNSLKDTQEEIDNLNNPLSIKEIEFVVKNLSTKKTLGPNNFLGEFYQHLREKLYQFHTNSSRKLRRSKFFPTHEFFPTL